MEKENILFVGQHPAKFTGNGNMLDACIAQLDKDKYDFCVFAQGEVPIELLESPFALPDYPIISATTMQDGWGKQKLINLLSLFDFDQVIFVGIDIWRYSDILSYIDQIKTKKKFLWKVIVPYDLPYVRTDWLNWLMFPDQVYVYSQHGYNLLKEYLPNVYYYRPSLRFNELYDIPSTEEKKYIRNSIFPDIENDSTIFCFVGANQLRKNIMRMLKGFSNAIEKREKEDMYLYLHMDTVTGVNNIEQLARDFNLPDKAIRHNGESRKLFPYEMATIYKAFDAHLLFSLQEGLSWTVIESKLAGVPSIISKTTAHHDFEKINNGSIFFVNPSETDAIPLMTESGPSYVMSSACSPIAIEQALLNFMDKKDKGEIQDLVYRARALGEQWCAECNDISTVLENKTTSSSNTIGELI